MSSSRSGDPCCPRSRCGRRMGLCRIHRSRRIPGDLLKRADMIGDGSAIKNAHRRNDDVVIGIEGSGRRRQRGFRVGKTGDRHHRQWWHIGLLFGADTSAGGALSRNAFRQERRHVACWSGTIWKQGRTVSTAASGVPLNLEKPTVRGKPGKIRVTGAARLAALSSVTRKCHR